MKRKIKLAFSDFWIGFEYNPTINTPVGDNVFYKMLSERFDIIINQKDPEYLIFSAFGNNHLSYKNCKKIFYTGENIKPNFNICDYSLSFEPTYCNNYRLPLSAITFYENVIIDKFERNKDIDKIKKEKTKFCNFIFSNPAPNSPRNEFFNKLSKYKKVDAGGRVLNNIGYLVKDKLKFQSEYKFTICFENTQSNFYTTEKIVHPKLVDSLPIYWGNPKVSDDWNTNSFIDAYKFSNLNEIVEYIKEVDNNDDLYEKIMLESHFKNDELSYDLNYKNFLNFFEKI